MDRASVASEYYNHVHVLLLSWERASAAFDEQLLQLKEVFEQGFRFRACKELICYDNSHNQLSKTLCKFLDENDDEDTLLILYYGGHGTTDSDGNAIWTW
jgi:molybdopterin biosynthesis enzyme MoaB